MGGGKPPYDRRNIGFADMIGIADIYPINARKTKKAGKTRPFNRLNDQCQYIRGHGSKAMSEH